MVGPGVQPNPAAQAILNTLCIAQSDILKAYHLLQCSIVANSSFFWLSGIQSYSSLICLWVKLFFERGINDDPTISFVELGEGM